MHLCEAVDCRKATVRRKIKDTLFRKLFGKSKENAISLYNQTNGTKYAVFDEFEVTMLADVIYVYLIIEDKN